VDEFEIAPKQFTNKKASKKQLQFVESLLVQYPSIEGPKSTDQRIVGAWLSEVTAAISAAGTDDPGMFAADYAPLEPSLESLEDFTKFDLAVPDLV